MRRFRKIPLLLSPPAASYASVTIYGYHVVMNVGIAHLKARLSEHLRRVRRGESVTVMDRNTPVARLVPFTSTDRLVLRPRRAGAPAPADVPLPPPLALDQGVDVVAVLLDERGAR